MKKLIIIILIPLLIIILICLYLHINVSPYSQNYVSNKYKANEQYFSIITNYIKSNLNKNVTTITIEKENYFGVDTAFKIHIFSNNQENILDISDDNVNEAIYHLFYQNSFNNISYYQDFCCIEFILDRGTLDFANGITYTSDKEVTMNHENYTVFKNIKDNYYYFEDDENKKN